MINENDRQALVDYRFRQATDTIELANFLAVSEKYIISVRFFVMHFKIGQKAIMMLLSTFPEKKLI